MDTRTSCPGRSRSGDATAAWTPLSRAAEGFVARWARLWCTAAPDDAEGEPEPHRARAIPMVRSATAAAARADSSLAAAP